MALYYGTPDRLADFRAFDTVVVDPDHLGAQALPQWAGTTFYAYASVGEVLRSRAYDKDIPAAWKIGSNAAWGSDLIDQSAPGWPDFFADRVIAPLWKRGFRGFFLDTLDSYRLATAFDEQAQQQGLVHLIGTLHQRFPGIRLVLNRGFDILPQVHKQVEMVAAESLYRRWNQAARRYEEVPDADHTWLLGQLQTVREQYRLPVLVIDYVPPHDRALTRATAQRIAQAGFIPWVSDADLSSVGIGNIEPVARRVLVLYSGTEAAALNYTNAHRYLQMPLNHMGYVVDYADVRKPLPTAAQQDRYAGVVTWFSGYIPQQLHAPLGRWLQERLDEGMPLAIIGDWGMPLERSLSQKLGVLREGSNAPTTLQPSTTSPLMGLENPPPPPGRQTDLVRLAPAMAAQAQPLIALRDARGQTLVGGAITPWGGFVLDPNVLYEIPGTEQARWIVDPFAFLQQSLRLPALPVPDTTTENGRRLLLAHVDGDGFPSVAELPGRPLAAEALLKNIFEKYRIPQTMSIVEAEVSPQGLHPDLSARMEDAARKMFRLPHIEVASHTYSHPFLWDNTVEHGIFSDGSEAAHSLEVPGYTMDLAREIVGSSQYINTRLAPPGKSVKILQWSGDTAPNAEALRITAQAGLLNINGGDTSISRTNPSLTAVGALGIRKENLLQVYAPTTNENIYTHLWTGPYYGFERVLETFAMTDQPRRIKPVGIYYHTYSASKLASLKALYKVYDWALAQPLHPVYASEFIAKVQDFFGMALAREDDGWRVRGNGALRTLRVPAALGTPQPALSQGVAGWREGQEGAYVHLTSGQALLRTQPAAPQTPSVPTLYEANARITQWDMQPQGGSFRLQGHVPLEWTLAMRPACQLRSNGALLAPVAPRNPGRSGLRSYRLKDATAQFQIQCPAP